MWVTAGRNTVGEWSATYLHCAYPRSNPHHHIDCCTQCDITAALISKALRSQNFHVCTTRMIPVFGSRLKYLQVQKCLLNWFEGCHGGQKALAKDWTGSWWATASGHSESIFTVSLLACDCYSATHSPLIYANPVMRVFRFWDKVFKVLRP